MEYRIEYTDTAKIELKNAFEWIREQSPFHAEIWREGIIDAVSSLIAFPERCPIAPENNVFDDEIRQLLYGKRHRTYRILFTIKKDIIWILHIRHGFRQRLGKKEK